MCRCHQLAANIYRTKASIFGKAAIAGSQATRPTALGLQPLQRCSFLQPTVCKQPDGLSCDDVVIAMVSLTTQQTPE